MRTSEQFKKVWSDMQWFVKFHNRCVWIVPTDKGYTISVIPPTAEELPSGTSANLYDVDYKIVRHINSSK